MKLNSLKKIIKYRSSYSGTKETDIMYERYFIRNLEKFNKNELNLLISVFDNYSDDLLGCDTLGCPHPGAQNYNEYAGGCDDGGIRLHAGRQ